MKYVLNLGLLLLAIFATASVYAEGLKRAEANRIVAEGEYLVKNGRHLRSSRRATKASPRKAGRRLPVARETSKESDMPFVSIPHRRVAHSDRTIVMEDPTPNATPPKP